MKWLAVLSLYASLHLRRLTYVNSSCRETCWHNCTTRVFCFCTCVCVRKQYMRGGHRLTLDVRQVSHFLRMCNGGSMCSALPQLRSTSLAVFRAVAQRLQATLSRAAFFLGC